DDVEAGRTGHPVGHVGGDVELEQGPHEGQPQEQHALPAGRIACASIRRRQNFGCPPDVSVLGRIDHSSLPLRRACSPDEKTGEPEGLPGQYWLTSSRVPCST